MQKMRKPVVFVIIGCIALLCASCGVSSKPSASPSAPEQAEREVFTYNIAQNCGGEVPDDAIMLKYWEDYFGVRFKRYS